MLLKATAMDLFRRKGFDATSIEEIASQAGVSVGTFYLHFRSKRQLLLVLMAELLARLEASDLQFAGPSHPRRVVKDLVARVLSADFEYIGAHRAWREAAMKDPDLAKKARELRAWTTGRVARVLESLLRLPGARSGVDVRALASVLDDYFWGLMAAAVDMSSAERKMAIGATVHLLYHALFMDEKS